MQNEELQVINQLTKFRLKRTIDHRDLFLRWKWFLHTLEILLLYLLLFSLFLSNSLTSLFSLCIARSESFLGFSKKTPHQKTKNVHIIWVCWVWHKCVIPRERETQPNKSKLNHVFIDCISSLHFSMPQRFSQHFFPCTCVDLRPHDSCTPFYLFIFLKTIIHLQKENLG